MNIEHIRHGNAQVISIDVDFEAGPCCTEGSASTFKPLMGEGAMIRRGEGEKMKKSAVYIQPGYAVAARRSGMRRVEAAL